MRYQQLELETGEPGALTGARWKFILLDGLLVVDGYQTWQRESKRHKPKISGHWERLNPRESTIKQDMVPFTSDIAAWAKREWLLHLENTVQVRFQA